MALPRFPRLALGALLATLVPPPLWGQPRADAYVHEAWTIWDGLPVNSVTDLLQSRDGYLWLTTFDGLVRFDGVRFTVFDGGNVAALPSSRFVEVTEARDGSLWLRTEQLHLLRYHEGQFTLYGPAQGLPSAEATVVYEDPAGALWVGTTRGLARFRDGRFETVPVLATPVEVTALGSDRAGALWVGTRAHGAVRLDRATRTAVTPRDGLLAPWVQALVGDADGALWMGTDKGVCRYGPGALACFPFEGGRMPPANHVWRDPTGVLWVHATDRLYRSEGGALVHVPVGETLAEGAPPLLALGGRFYRHGHLAFETPAAISAVVEDHEGSLWLATAQRGLHQLKPALFSVVSEPEGLPERNVYPVLAGRDGAIWAGLDYRGLARLRDGVVTSLTTRDGLPDDAVRALLEDVDGNVWVGTYAGACRIPAAERAAAHPRCVPVLTGFPVFALYQDHRGDMWAGTGGHFVYRGNGVYRYHNGAWTHYTTADGLSHDFVRAIHETRGGALWFGTNGGGLTIYRDGRFRSFTTADGLSSDLVRVIYEDERGVVWVGTEDRGLNRIEVDAAGHPVRVAVIREADGLFDDGLHTILPDGAGRLWMSTNRGIFHVDRAELDAFAAGRAGRVRSTAYTERAGLRNREANGGCQPAGARAPDGRLWFPTQDGLAVVDPAHLGADLPPPPVVVEHVAAGDAAFPAPAARLPLGVRDFEVAYTALSFLAPENVRFRYRLEGFDDDWVEAGARRTAFYTNVPPGRYTFRVTASNADGEWDGPVAEVALTVPPRFHETGAFLALCALGLVAAGAGGVGWRVRRQRARERELRALVAARTAEVERQKAHLEAQNAQIEAQAEALAALDEAKSRFFANLSHEFRTPLTLLLGPLQDALAHPDGSGDAAIPRARLRAMLRNSQRLLRLVNQLLDLARLEAGHLPLDPRPHDLVTFVRDTTLAFAPLAERLGTALTWEAQAPALPLLFDRDKLEKVLANLLSNALKFTPRGGAVHVAVGWDEEAVRIAVSDTGVGIPAAELPRVFDRFHQVDGSTTRAREGTGIGLALAKELAELHGGRITAESTPGQGSTFTVHLPFRPAPTGDDGEAETPPSGDVSGAADVEVAVGLDGRAAPDTGFTPTNGDGHPWPDDEPADEADRTTVLVVDDNADVRAYVRTILEPAYRVIEAADGQAGLEAARETLPDLVVADVMMPALDGLGLSRALKADPATDCIPVVLLTARASRADEVEGLGTGADDYVTKPFHAGALRARVDNLIALRRRLRERLRAEGAPAASAPPEPPAEAMSAFERQVRAVVTANLTEPGFDVEALAEAVALSRSQLHRRLREEAGTTPSALIRTVRVEAAARLLREGAGTVSEVAYAVGFESLSHFSRCFRAHYGVNPSAYAREGAAG
ncbi:MAG TPA: two-component regulator propeller domain-containing protein [Rubricoccaceae bacterium]|nr:two-component regulator propeller domain-containing protein [Rubricoccaceae bacterium]